MTTASFNGEQALNKKAWALQGLLSVLSILIRTHSVVSS
ncbi:hypothetical protein CEV32_2481 [Brucella rhizosphaerae]|uniref:Uncharacterized protein n=1 Tax=Brucella rhizosphaerae TaxID=571254 RepID=A0A256F5D0_9HYPH|nr:hypothetical protein CEV32_2481 [Brucella rhizosphaerae]